MYGQIGDAGGNGLGHKLHQDPDRVAPALVSPAVAESEQLWQGNRRVLTGEQYAAW